jgi:hypothetical protein
MRDQMSLIQPVVAIAPQTQTNSSSAIVGEIVDRAGFESLTFVISAGTMTDANATFAVTMEHGDDSALSDTAAVAAPDLVGTFALAAFQFDDDKECRKIGYVGSKRYTRLTITPTGNDSGAAPLSAVALKGNPASSPTANPPQ